MEWKFRIGDAEKSFSDRLHPAAVEGYMPYEEMSTALVVKRKRRGGARGRRVMASVASAKQQEVTGVAETLARPNQLQIFLGNLAAGAVAGCTVEGGKWTGGPFVD